MIDAPDAYEFTSHRPLDRQRAMDMTLRTLELAAEFGARYLVLHMGSVPMNPKKWTKPLTAMVAAGRQLTARISSRPRSPSSRNARKLAPLYYHRAIEALETIAEHAAELGVKLAIESRSRFEDMPTEREMLAPPGPLRRQSVGRLLARLRPRPAQAQPRPARPPRVAGANLAAPHRRPRPRRRMAGPRPPRPFQRHARLPALLPFFPPDCPLVWELSPTREAEEIREALAVWHHKFPERC